MYLMIILCFQVIASDGFAHLSKLTSLEMIETFSCDPGLAGLQHVGNVLHKMPCMERIHVDEQRSTWDFNDDTAKALASGLAKLPKLQELNLLGVCMNRQAARYVQKTPETVIISLADILDSWLV